MAGLSFHLASRFTVKVLVVLAFIALAMFYSFPMYFNSQNFREEKTKQSGIIFDRKIVNSTIINLINDHRAVTINSRNDIKIDDERHTLRFTERFNIMEENYP